MGEQERGKRDQRERERCEDGHAVLAAGKGDDGGSVVPGFEHLRQKIRASYMRGSLDKACKQWYVNGWIASEMQRYGFEDPASNEARKLILSKRGPIAGYPNSGRGECPL